MPRHVAPSTLACMHCFKSKCKCVSRPDGQGCERCYRLNKQCRSSDSVRKNANAYRRQNSAARIRSLEAKVDSLVQLLSIVSQSPAISATLGHVSREDGFAQLLHPDVDDQDATDDAASSTTSSPSPNGRSDDALDAEVPFSSDAEAHLATFRNKMLPSFSFIHLSPTVTAEQLQRDRPLFMRAVMAVATSSKSQKIVYGRKFKEILANSTLLENQNSLDLLQALLVFIAWGYDHMHTPSSTPSRLMMLAIALACELRLDKPLPSDEHMMKPMVDESFEQQHNQSQDWFVAEEQRAVLACYALSSIISIYFAQIDVMKWKPRMEESLRTIESNSGCPADVAFAFQVRLQQLAQKAVQFREQREWDFARVGVDPGPDLSACFYIRTLQTQLQQLNDALPHRLRERGTLIMHRHYIELCVNETGRNLYLHANPSLAPITAAQSNLAIDELDFSWRSVGTIKAWMHAFFTLSPGECGGLSFIHQAQLARCLMVLYRLSTYVHPGWDCNLVRNTLDILSVLDGVARNFELASREAGERVPEDQFMSLAGLMRKFRDKAASEMGRNASSIGGGLLINGSTETMATCGSETTTVLQEAMLLQPMGAGDAQFLDSIFRDFGHSWSV
ncbi:hypothetical protein DM02DRAFT_540322 [Periconia macrospinosa]|uniref:Zn(2)-C6 fungal-type domain-containing protein n=1 Tax=Periconia macrospinosa TaxID=97972 RepID=A0A2V1D9Z4_9PLEO|nr:hypothetical protein DM02DRAFT_540322 [Periconia macrospinosa]